MEIYRRGFLVRNGQESAEKFSELFPLSLLPLLPLCNNNSLLGLSRYFSGTGRIRFWRGRFQTPNSVSFLVLAEFRELSEFLSAYYLCAKHTCNLLPPAQSRDNPAKKFMFSGSFGISQKGLPEWRRFRFFFGSFPVVFRLFRFFVFFPFSSVFFVRFLPLSSVFFFSVSKKKRGDTVSRDPFCKTPVLSLPLPTCFRLMLVWLIISVSALFQQWR